MSQRGDKYRSQTVQTDSQGRFQADLADIDYNDYARNSLGKNQQGHTSYTVSPVRLRPGKDQHVIIVIDPPSHQDKLLSASLAVFEYFTAISIPNGVKGLIQTFLPGLVRIGE